MNDALVCVGLRLLAVYLLYNPHGIEIFNRGYFHVP